MPDTSLVLVVDDNPVVQQITVRALSRAGYRTCTADDGQAALRLARSEKPDLILLDVMLPEPLTANAVRLQTPSHQLHAPSWVERTASQLGLESTLRAPHRRRKIPRAETAET